MRRFAISLAVAAVALSARAIVLAQADKPAAYATGNVNSTMTAEQAKFLEVRDPEPPIQEPLWILNGNKTAMKDMGFSCPGVPSIFSKSKYYTIEYVPVDVSGELRYFNKESLHSGPLPKAAADDLKARAEAYERLMGGYK